MGTVHHGLPANSLSMGARQGGYLAFLGRISPEKGIDRAIEIAIRSGRRLKIAAKIDRADREYFEKKIEPLLDHPLVEFIGEIGHCEKGEFLGNALALLAPIQWPEPFGLVMIEAMACGTPVIAHPYGSVPEIVLHGISGFQVNDIDEAVRTVGRLGGLDRADCRRHFERNFTDERMARDYVDIYEQLVRPASASIAVEEGVLNWMEAASPTPSTT
jgi:glycosyltransferase involved in cell wall biosynthesis